MSKASHQNLRAAIRLLFELFNLFLAILATYVESFKELLFDRERKDITKFVIVITGAGQGLGQQLALQLSSLGAKVALIDLIKQTNDAVAREIVQNGGEAVAFTCDVRDESAVKQTIQQIKERFGKIDVLINNAGVVQCLPISAMNSLQIKRTFEVNVLAHFWTIRAVLPLFEAAGGKGHIVAISSIAGLLGTPNLVDYCASKHAVVGLMASLEREIHVKGCKDINFTTICPLIMDTGMFKAPKSGRFPALFPVLTAEEVAAKSIDAILKNKSLVTVPASGEFSFRFGQ